MVPDTPLQVLALMLHGTARGVPLGRLAVHTMSLGH